MTVSVDVWRGQPCCCYLQFVCVWECCCIDVLETETVMIANQFDIFMIELTVSTLVEINKFTDSLLDWLSCLKKYVIVCAGPQPERHEQQIGRLRTNSTAAGDTAHQTPQVQ